MIGQKMIQVFTPHQHPLHFKIFRIAIAVALVFAFELPTSEARADTNLVKDTYLTFSEFVTTTVGYEACGYPCAALGAFAAKAVNTDGPTVVKKAATKSRSGVTEMLTKWGATYVSP